MPIIRSEWARERNLSIFIFGQTQARGPGTGRGRNVKVLAIRIATSVFILQTACLCWVLQFTIMKYPLNYLILVLCTANSYGKNTRVDPHSHANIEDARVTNVSLELDINFEDSVLNGSVILSIERMRPEAKFVVSF